MVFQRLSDLVLGDNRTWGCSQGQCGFMVPCLGAGRRESGTLSTADVSGAAPHGAGEQTQASCIYQHGCNPNAFSFGPLVKCCPLRCFALTLSVCRASAEVMEEVRSILPFLGFQNNFSCRAIILLVLRVDKFCCVWRHNKYHIHEFICNFSLWGDFGVEGHVSKLCGELTCLPKKNVEKHIFFPPYLAKFQLVLKAKDIYSERS